MDSLKEQPEPSPVAELVAWLIHRCSYLLYHQFAWAYDIVAWVVSLGLWNQWIKTIHSFLDNRLVLELGYGPGHLQASLHQMGIPCIGVDQSPVMSRQALRRLRRICAQPSLINGLVQYLPFPSNIFSQIIATFPTEYIADRQTLAEIYRVLTPGGSVTILLSAWMTGEKFFERLSAWLFRVTGEPQIWNEHFLAPAQSVGFVTQTKYISLQTSKLLYMVLQKPAITKNLTTG